MAQNCPDDFSHENTIYNANPQKASTARRHFATALSPEVNSYTLEVSLLGFEDEEGDASAAAALVVPYTDEMYCRVGRNLARAFWDYFKIMGFIPLDPSEGGKLTDKWCTASMIFFFCKLVYIFMENIYASFTRR